MAAQLKKQLVLFPHPMGERVLHFVSLPGKSGPWLAFDEACLKVFGVDSPVQAKSKETVRKAARKINGKEGHLVVCDDADVKRLLVSAGVIGPQAAKFTMMSAAALEMLVTDRGGGPGMLHALKQIDHSELLEGPFIDNQRPSSDNTCTSGLQATHNVQMRERPVQHTDSLAPHLTTPSACLPRNCGQQDNDSDADMPSFNETGGLGNSSDEIAGGEPLQGHGRLAPDPLNQRLQFTSQATRHPADSLSNRPTRDKLQPRLPVDPHLQCANTKRLTAAQQPNQTLRRLSATPNRSDRGIKRPSQVKLSSPTFKKRMHADKSLNRSMEPVRPGSAFRKRSSRDVDDIDEYDEGLPCSDTDELYDGDDDDEEAQLRRAFRTEARLLRQSRAPPSVRLDNDSQGRWSSRQLQSDYGLKEVHMSKTLEQQLKLLVDKLASTSIEPLRRNVASQPLAPATIDKFKKDVCRYLGYCRNIKGMSDRYITLSAFSNTDIFSDFLEFINARTRGGPSNKLNDMLTVTLVAIRVNHFLANLLARQSGYSLLATDHSASRAIQYLEDISAELRMLKRREAGSNVRETPSLPSAPEILHFVEKLIDGALNTFEDEAESSDTESEGTRSSSPACLLSMKACQQVRDAAIMAMLAGHVCLTVRISIIRTLKASCFSNKPCSQQGCTLPNCMGNRLEVIEQTSDSSEVPQYRIVVPHHKTAPKGIMMPPVSIHSKKLTRLLHIWEQHARPQLARRLAAKYEDWQDPETLFFTNRGSPFPRLSDWYSKLHVHYAAPFKLVPLNKYRNIFVTDRLQNPDVPGPSNEGAAIIMGNSVPTWEAVYHNNRRAWLADQAAADAEVYRLARINSFNQQYGGMEEEEEDEYATAESDSE